jgi:intein/homing endonuclease
VSHAPNVEEMADEELLELADHVSSLASPIGMARRCLGDAFQIRSHTEVISNAFVDLMEGRYDRMILVTPPQVGKPVHDGAMILMGDGSRRELKDIRIGDTVITHRGRPRPVTAVHVQGELPCLRVTTSSGRSTIAAHDHPFLTPEGWVKAADLVVGQVLAAVPRPRTEPTGALTGCEARLLGYFVGDGSVSAHTRSNSFAASITTASPTIDAEIRRCCEELGFAVGSRLYARKDGSVNKARSLGISGGVRDWLRTHQLGGTTSHTKRVPSAVFTAPPEVVAEFIAGYWDCDGVVTPRGRARDGSDRLDVAVELYSVSRDLLADVQHLLLRLGVASTIRTKVGTYKDAAHVSYRLAIIARDDVARFRDRVFLRQEVRARRLAAHPLLRTAFDAPLTADPIVAIEDAGQLPCRCLTVDEDHTFTSDDLVVHNSWVAGIWAPFWWLCNRPADRLAVVSYGLSLAVSRGRAVRRLVNEHGARYGIALAGDSRAVNDWHLAGTDGGLRCVGIGGGLTGNPVDGCVTGDTLIATPAGETAVRDYVHQGLAHPVLAYDHAAGRAVWGRVRAAQISLRSDLVQVTTQDGRRVECTGDHPFYVPGRGYVAAAALTPGTRLGGCRIRGPTLPSADLVDVVEEVRPARRGDQPVYDLQVAGVRNFFANGVLVHNCLIIDDPHKDRAEADSMAKREAVHEWYSSTGLSRLAPSTVACIIQTRWHEDDLAGRRIAEEGRIEEGGRWKVLHMPALAGPGDILGREPGEPLEHPRIPRQNKRAALVHWRDKRATSTARDWGALYQGDPKPMEGALVSRELMARQTHHGPLPSPHRVGVAVDPSGGGRDTAGIIGGHTDATGRLFWTDDRTDVMTSDAWARAACELAADIDADRIVVEANYGGDQTTSLLRFAWKELLTGWDDEHPDEKNPYDRPMPYLVPVHSRRGKLLRAEPVAGFLAQDRIRLAPGMPELVGEWTSWQPDSPDSPGRIDAAVHLAYALVKALPAGNVVSTAAGVSKGSRRGPAAAARAGAVGAANPGPRIARGKGRSLPPGLGPTGLG